MSTATPSDVNDVLDASLEDGVISPHLQRAAEDNARVNDVDDQDEIQTRRIEELLAAIKLLSQSDRVRSTTSQGIGNANKSFETGKIAELRGELSKWDPSGELGSTVRRDIDRNVTTTGGN